MAVYLVKTPDGKERLVDAANKASARNHAARDTITVDVAKQADLFRIAKAGGDIETAGEVVAESGDGAAAGEEGQQAEPLGDVLQDGETVTGKPKK